MSGLTKSQKQDYQRFFKEQGDPGFSPERNKAIIEHSIEKYEATRRIKQKIYTEQVGERADAIATYLKSIDTGRTSGNVEKYFGKRELARLQGQRIIQRLQGNRIVLEDINS